MGDDIVAFMDAEAKPLPTPEWIRRSGSPRVAPKAGQRVAATHPADRQRVIELWWEAVHKPGEVCETECLVQGDEGWVREWIRQINLFDVEDIGAMVFVVRILGAADASCVPDMIQEGEFEEVDLLIHELDGTGVIIRTEGKVFEITGRQPEEVIGQSVLDHIHPDGFEDAISMWMATMTGPPGATRTGRQRVVRPDGSIIWTESTTIKRVAEDGTITATVICHDLTARRKQEAALRTFQMQFQLLADLVPSAVFQADSEHRLTFRNSRWDELISGGTPVEHLYDIVHPDDREKYDAEIARLAASPGRTVSFEVRGRAGERVYSVLCESVIDIVSDVRSFVGAVTDITSTVELRQRAERDSLTGLLNRPSLEEHIARAIADEGKEIVVAFIDLDGFKSVNDRYGHHVGDDVLVAIGERLGTIVRADDVVARFGGDEFVVVIHSPGVDDDAVVERLEDALRAPIRWDGGEWYPKASIGVARPQAGDDVAAVLRQADDHMFAIKRRRKLASAS